MSAPAFDAAALPPEIRRLNARLPGSYEAARTALAACESIDECQDWANRAEALASYAKQAEDGELRRLADRIQARAVRRCGELLKEINGRGINQYSEGGVGADTKLTQRQAAAAAGLSKRQQVTAVRVANLPEQRFEDAVDAERPATVTALADMGRQRRPAPASFRALSARRRAQYWRRLRQALEALNALPPDGELANVVPAGAAATVDELLPRARALLDAFERDWRRRRGAP